jgi:hypothetical protein
MAERSMSGQWGDGPGLSYLSVPGWRIIQVPRMGRKSFESTSSNGTTHDRPVDQQRDDRPYDRSDEAGRTEGWIPRLEELAQEPADQRADQAENERPQNPHGISPGYQQPSHRSGCKPDDQPPDDVHVLTFPVVGGKGNTHRREGRTVRLGRPQGAGRLGRQLARHPESPVVLAEELEES